MFQLGVVVTVACIALYWLYRAIASAPGRKVPSIALLSGVLAILGLLIAHERLDHPRRTFVQTTEPALVVAIAVDLSLSMLAAPDPRTHPDVESRLARVQGTLLTLLDRLEASRTNVLSGVTAFTARSEIILAWDPKLSQTREAVAYVLAPDIMTDPGTDLGAAVDGLARLFDLLPPNYQANTRKVAIVVSDGEVTVEQVDLVRALDGLRSKGVHVVSLQVGMVGVSEGIRVLGDRAEFLGFRDVGGQTYTIPDPRAMQMMAGDGKTGLYVRAEDPQAAAKIHGFLGAASAAEPGVERLRLLIVWVLWGMSMLIVTRLLVSSVPRRAVRRVRQNVVE